MPTPKKRLGKARGTEGAEPSTMIDTSIDLTKDGEHFLGLLGTRHPYRICSRGLDKPRGVPRVDYHHVSIGIF